MSAWRRARLVRRQEQSRTGRTLLFDVPQWPGHLAGQHVDVRLSADDGYQAIRSYSLAAPTEGDGIELGVQTVPGGEVSPILRGTCRWVPMSRCGDRWAGGSYGDPSRGVGPSRGGGCGIVPLMAMIRAHRLERSTAPMRLVYSVRDPAQVWYRDELAGGAAGATVPGSSIRDARHRARPGRPGTSAPTTCRRPRRPGQVRHCASSAAPPDSWSTPPRS
ncbi:FAD-binding oxidoreductase [Streptomyces zhihengii]